MNWVCNFCGKSEDKGMVHDTCVRPGVDTYFCVGCWAQWLGNKKTDNVNVLKLKRKYESYVEDDGGEEEYSPC